MAIEQTLEDNKMSSHILTAMKLLVDRDQLACQPLIDQLIDAWYIRGYRSAYQRMHTCSSKEVFYNYRTGRFTINGNFGSTIYIGELNINRMKGRAISEAERFGTPDKIGEVLLTKLADNVNKRRAELIAAHEVGSTTAERRAILPKHEWGGWMVDVRGNYAPENLLDRDILGFIVKATARRLNINDGSNPGPVESHILKVLDESGRVDAFLDFFKSLDTSRFLAVLTDRYGNGIINECTLLYRILGLVRGANSLIEAFDERYTDISMKGTITRESVDELVSAIKGGAELTVGENELNTLEEMVKELARSNSSNAFENIKVLSEVLANHGRSTETLIRSVDYIIGLHNQINELVTTPNLRPLVLGFKKAPATDDNFKTSIFFDRTEFIKLVLSDVEFKAIWTNISRDRLLFELEHSVTMISQQELEYIQDYFNHVTVLDLTQDNMFYLINEKNFDLNYTKFFSDIFDWEGAPTI